MLPCRTRMTFGMLALQQSGFSRLRRYTGFHIRARSPFATSSPALLMVISPERRCHQHSYGCFCTRFKLKCVTCANLSRVCPTPARHQGRCRKQRPRQDLRKFQPSFSSGMPSSSRAFKDVGRRAPTSFCTILSPSTSSQVSSASNSSLEKRWCWGLSAMPRGCK